MTCHLLSYITNRSRRARMLYDITGKSSHEKRIALTSKLTARRVRKMYLRNLMTVSIAANASTITRDVCYFVAPMPTIAPSFQNNSNPLVN